MGETREGEDAFISVSFKEFCEVWALRRGFDNRAMELSVSTYVRAFGRSDFFGLLRCDETVALFPIYFGGDAEDNRRDFR